MNKKEQQFIDWLCGKKVRFPYLKNLPEVPMPKIYKQIRKLDEQKTNQTNSRRSS